MPQLASIEIPVLSSSPRSVKQWHVKPRNYEDEKPLRVQPSSYAPKNARIISRTVDDDGVNYNLKIGDVDISDVSVEEILEYVSALDLEAFENREFEDERKVLKVIEAEEELRRQQMLERAKLKVKRRSIVAWETDTGSSDESETPVEAIGKHGRARPTYTQFYLRAPLHNVGQKVHTPTIASREIGSENESHTGRSATGVEANPPIPQLKKRRRRKRDPVTGELIPLEPLVSEVTEVQKRSRRRRHPITNELMPLGWRYDPNAPDEGRTGQPSSSFKKLSISDEREAKRVKLQTDIDNAHSSLFSSSKALADPLSKAESIEEQRPSGIASPAKLPVFQVLSSDDDVDEELTLKDAFRQMPKPPLTVRSSNLMVQSALQPPRSETSPEPESFLSKPGATGHVPEEPPPQTLSNSDAEEVDESEEEWFVEDIVGHSWSDPKTHPTEFGHEPVMLYQVKWAGYQTPTWYKIAKPPYLSATADSHHAQGTRRKFRRHEHC